LLTIKTLSLAEAQVALDAAQAKAKELGMPEVLCVADASGYPIVLRRLDGGKVTSVQIALNKAFTAAGHRRPMHQYKNATRREGLRHLHPSMKAASQFSSAATRSLSTGNASARSLPRAVTAGIRRCARRASSRL